MKAAQCNSYGGPEVIQVNGNASKPTLKAGQILIENYAASINAFDYKLRAGYMQKMIPLTFPFTIGGDFAGKVIELGDDVTDFAIGDEVYGQAIVLNGGSGAMADLVASNTKNTAKKPMLVNFEEASALPLVGTSAVQALEDHMHVHREQKILIHGGAGGIGHIAIQIAKSLGAYVATTVGSKDIDFAKSLGADEVIDYKTQKFEDMLKDFDAVYDTVGGQIAEQSFQVLKKGGVLVSMLGAPDSHLAEQYGVTAIGQQTKTNAEHLKRLAEIVDAGKVKVHVDKVFPLGQVRNAFVYQENNHPQGKVVVKIL